jgi:hypothetical protein
MLYYVISWTKSGETTAGVTTLRPTTIKKQRVPTPSTTICDILVVDHQKCHLVIKPGTIAIRTVRIELQTGTIQTRATKTELRSATSEPKDYIFVFNNIYLWVYILLHNTYWPQFCNAVVVIFVISVYTVLFIFYV